MGVDDALKDLLDGIEPLAPVPVELEEALGLVLAEPILARERHPAEDTSAMDGYAVRAEELLQASTSSPVRLTVGEDIRAGFPSELSLEPGRCARISTGALLPPGADAVEMREYVEVIQGRAVFTRPLEPGANIRLAGEHLSVGEEGLGAGTILGPSQLGMAAYLGVSRPLCRPRLRIAVLATGSELVEGGGELARGQIRDSNGIALASAVRQLGCDISLRERVADEGAALDLAIDRAVAGSDVLLTSGGISAGWHDLVRERIERSGGTFVFHKLRMRPGKPVAFGRIGKVWVFCLPGNPVSSLVTFEVFVKPALRKLMARPHRTRTVRAVLAEPVEKKRGFTVFFRVKLDSNADGSLTASLSGPQASHQLKSMVNADGLMALGEDVERLEPGHSVEVRLWD